MQTNKYSRRIEILVRRAELITDHGDRKVWEVRGGLGYVSAVYIEPLTSNNPSPRPWHLVCVGTTHETPEAALEAFVAGWFKPSAPVDRSYERAVACFGEQP